MPIRFRCPHCNRLLGIARRKAGTQIDCPQCSRAVTVPRPDGFEDLAELDELLNSGSTVNGSAHPGQFGAARDGGPSSAWPQPEFPYPAVPTKRPRPDESQRPTVSPAMPPGRPPVSDPQPVETHPPVVPAGPRSGEHAHPQRRRKPDEERPLFETDVDKILALNKLGEKLELEEAEEPRAKPVSGMDVNSLDDEPRKLVLSVQKAALLGFAVIVLLVAAFAAGFLIASNL